jgi:hypothetical protein
VSIATRSGHVAETVDRIVVIPRGQLVADQPVGDRSDA